MKRNGVPKTNRRSVALDRQKTADRPAAQNRSWLRFVGFLGAFLVALGSWLLHRWIVTPTSYLQVLSLPVLNASEAGALHHFFNTYHGRSPVLILGVVDSWPAMRWDEEYLRAVCPDAEVPLYSYDIEGSEWAALREVGAKPLSEYLASEFGQSARPRREKLYALEMGLRIECPALLSDVRIPAFFSDDMLLRYYPKISWPTLIAGPQGTRSGLHKDTHNFPFYMAMFKGRKQWRIFSIESRDAYEPYFDPQTNGFTADAFEPDFRLYPRLGQAVVYDHVLEPGQLLYIPSGAPHAARNLEDTLAISGNFLDGHSLPRHKEVTCQGDMWANSPLCVGYMFDFDRHRSPEPGALQERSYFKQAGHEGAQEWCVSFLPSLQQRAERKSTLARNVGIVRKYCNALSNSKEH